MGRIPIFGSIMGVLRQLATYLYLRKKDPAAPTSQWIRYMHGINRISLLLFLFAIVVMIVRSFLK
ncbi:MAG: hypothetical protein FJX83_03315 [Bacteroidetes bacterium]|nr:hypothetical protein [Bacteroidota bacterium]